MYSYFDNEHWVTPFGLIFVAAILIAWAYARWNAQRAALDPSHIDLLVPVTLIVGIAGGQVIAMFMPMDHMMAGEAMNHGVRIRLFPMLASGAVAVFIYCRIAGLGFRSTLDIFALPTLAGLMIHRVGCHIAGCCWGDVVTTQSAGSFAAQVQTWPVIGALTSGVEYPPGSLPYEQHLAMGMIEPGAFASLPVVPVQLYEALFLLLVMAVLVRFRWLDAPRGTLTVIVTCAYSVGRFFIEYLRADGHLVVGNLTIVQVQCMLLVCTWVLLPGMLQRRRPAT